MVHSNWSIFSRFKVLVVFIIKEGTKSIHSFGCLITTLESPAKAIFIVPPKNPTILSYGNLFCVGGMNSRGENSVNQIARRSAAYSSLKVVIKYSGKFGSSLKRMVCWICVWVTLLSLEYKFIHITWNTFESFCLFIYLFFGRGGGGLMGLLKYYSLLCDFP